MRPPAMRRRRYSRWSRRAAFSVSVLTAKAGSASKLDSPRIAKRLRRPSTRPPSRSRPRPGPQHSHEPKKLIAEAQTGADRSAEAGRRGSSRPGYGDTFGASRLRKIALRSDTFGLSWRVYWLCAIPATDDAEKGAYLFSHFLHGGQIDSRSRDAIKSIIGSANRAGETIYVVDLSSVDLQPTSKLSSPRLDQLEGKG